MRAFWSLLNRDLDLTYHVHVLAKELRPEVIAVLWRESILEHAEPAGWYPCPGPEGEGCPMRALPAALGNHRAVLVVCGQRPPQCIELCLDASALARVTVSLPKLVKTLGRVLSIDLGDLPDARRSAGIHPMGTMQLGGERVAVYLARHTAFETFPAFLLSLRAARGRSLVLAASASRLPPELVAQYSVAGDRVELQFLDRLVVLSNDRLVLSTPLADDHLAQALPCCALVDARGCRPIAADERQRIIDGHEGHELVADHTVPVERGFYVYLRRAEGWVRERLAIDRMALLTELMEARRPLAPDDFRSVDVNNLVRLFQKMRQQLEGNGKSGRHAWRFLHTRHGEPGDDRRRPLMFEFAPGPGVRFALLRPLT